MRLWYDPSGGVHGINTANWFAEHVGLAYPTDCTFHEIPPPQLIAQELPHTDGLLELLPIIRYGRADLIIQSDEKDNHESWIENEVILVIEVTAMAPHGKNFHQRADKFVPSANLGIPTAYILPQYKLSAGTVYEPTAYQTPFFGMLNHRYDTPVMHVLWPATAQGVLFIDPTPAWQPGPNYWGEPRVQGQVQTFIDQCQNYLVNHQPVPQAFAAAIATNQADFITYQNQYERGARWRARRNVQATSVANVGITAHANVLARQNTLVLGPRSGMMKANGSLRLDDFTGAAIFADQWVARLLAGDLEYNTVWHCSVGSINDWNNYIQNHMNVHDENADCPFHNPAAFTPQTAADHMLEDDPGCPFNNAYARSKWMTTVHAVIFPDGVWTSPYRR